MSSVNYNFSLITHSSCTLLLKCIYLFRIVYYLPNNNNKSESAWRSTLATWRLYTAAEEWRVGTGHLILIRHLRGRLPLLANVTLSCSNSTQPGPWVLYSADAVAHTSNRTFVDYQPLSRHDIGIGVRAEIRCHIVMQAVRASWQAMPTQRTWRRRQQQKWSARVNGGDPSRGKSTVQLRAVRGRRQTAMFTLR